MPKIKVRFLSISKILTINEYWNLIGREQFLATTWEPDFSQACNFRRMLMNHKNFRFTQIPDKTNDMIFLKSPKALLCAPNTMLSLRKKLTSQFWEKLWTDGKTDRWMERKMVQGCHSLHALKIEEIWEGIANFLEDVCQNLAQN